MTDATTTAPPLGRRFFNKSKLHDDARKVCSQLPKAELTIFGRGSKGVREPADAAKIAALATYRGDSFAQPGVSMATTEIKRYGVGPIERKPYLPIFTDQQFSFIK